MAGKTVYLVEVCKPVGSVETWTTSMVCGADDLHGIVHVVAQSTFEDEAADCTFYCSESHWWHVGEYPAVLHTRDITCLRCLAEVEPALLRILG